MPFHFSLCSEERLINSGVLPGLGCDIREKGHRLSVDGIWNRCDLMRCEGCVINNINGKKYKIEEKLNLFKTNINFSIINII